MPTPPSTSRCASILEARNLRHTYVTGTPDQPLWRVQQVLVDADMVNDWVAEFDIDVVASRVKQQPVLWMTRIGAIRRSLRSGRALASLAWDG